MLEIENGVQVQPHFNLDTCRKKWYDLFNDELELTDKNILEEAIEDESIDKEEVDAEILATKRMIFLYLNLCKYVYTFSLSFLKYHCYEIRACFSCPQNPLNWFMCFSFLEYLPNY